MKLFDLMVAKQAAASLDVGNVREAAKLIIESPDRAHRSLQNIRETCGQRLIKLARELFSKEEVALAQEHMLLAKECIELWGDDAQFASQINNRFIEMDMKRTWRLKRLEDARQLASCGRMRTATEAIAPLAGDSEAELFRADLNLALDRFSRYVGSCNTCMADNDRQGVEYFLNKAKDISPRHQAIIKFERWLSQLNDQATNVIKPPSHTVPPDIFIVQIGERTKVLVTTRSSLTIGNASGPADIPIDTPELHSQHAFILRHIRHGIASYWIGKHPSHNALVSVNGQPLESETDSIGCVQMRAGDIIQMGKSQSRVSATWRFWQNQVDDFQSATLCGGAHTRQDFQSVIGDPEKFAYSSQELANRSVTSVGRHDCCTIMLAANQFRVSRTGIDGHVQVEHLPVPSVSYALSKGCVKIEVQDGGAFYYSPDGDEVNTEHAPVPGRAEVFCDAYVEGNIHDMMEQSMNGSNNGCLTFKHFHI